MKEKIQNAISFVLIILALATLMVSYLTEEPKGYYVGTETMQPDGTYYIWVEK